MSRNIMTEWGFTADQLTELVCNTPSLRGMLLGYVAEMKLQQLLRAIPGLTDKGKKDDHDRSGKGDRLIEYKGRLIKIEAKSLQTNSIKKTADMFSEREVYSGSAQVDASDRRDIVLPDGTKLNTTCLLRGEFDILAVNCFAFENKWNFVFARNDDLPCSKYRKYSEYQRNCILASLVTVTWPPQPPFYSDPVVVLEATLREGEPSTGRLLNKSSVD